MPEKMNMLYRKLGRTDIRISALSFGTMRWTSAESCYETVQRGIDAGMNYFDTSTGYVAGQSEVWTGRAVRGRRSEILFSSKIQYGRAPNETAVRAAIEASLRRTGLDYFDFYQLWGLGSMDMLKAALKPGGFADGVRRAMKDGLVRMGCGFTFHGTPDVFRAAVDSGEFLCATVSYNAMNRAEEENVRYAEQKGVGIFVMNPLGGGVLAMAGDKKYDFLKGPGGSPAYGALRFLLANSGVTAALLGLSRPEQVDTDLEALRGTAELNEAWRDGLATLIDGIRLTDPGFCTGCRYCEICDNGFSPSKLMQTIRNAKLYSVVPENMKQWVYAAYTHDRMPEEQLADCTECGKCQEKCPQKLKIVGEIQGMKRLFSV
jgi:predicted aldo/keto reductase-like oxidoreductase